jgi:hypothetical protein
MTENKNIEQIQCSKQFAKIIRETIQWLESLTEDTIDDTYFGINGHHSRYLKLQSLIRKEAKIAANEEKKEDLRQGFKEQDVPYPYVYLDGKILTKQWIKDLSRSKWFIYSQTDFASYLTQLGVKTLTGALPCSSLISKWDMFSKDYWKNQKSLAFYKVNHIPLHSRKEYLGQLFMEDIKQENQKRNQD